MTNEEKLQLVVKDPYLFISTFMQIVDKRGKLVPFKPNPQQTALLKGMDKFNVVLKSRQLGITVLSCAYSLWLATTRPNIHCLLMAHSLQGSNGIFEKLKQLYYGLPQRLRQPLLVNNKQELKFTNGSRISVIACGKKESVRGSTLHFVHVSEAAFCSENIEQQILAIEQCLTPNGKIIVESTAKGFNYFSDMYFKAERGESLYKPFFFSWVDDKVMFADEYRQFVERYIALNGSLPTINELDKTELALYHKGASIEQLVWRRLKISNSNESSFAQEFPSSPTEAFINTGTNVCWLGWLWGR